MIKSLNEVSNKTDEGKLLIMALSKLTCTTYTDKTPDKVIKILGEMADSMEW
jgi:hypothetical protein